MIANLTTRALTLLVLFAVTAIAAPLTAQDSRPESKQEGQPKSKPKGEAEAKPGKVPDKAYVKMTTSLGDMIIELNAKKAPATVKNFLTYAEEGFYKGLTFHRVKNDFMVQGGGFAPGNVMRPKTPTHKPIKNEADNGVKNEYGTIAMARTGDPHSATSQFFINVKKNGFLDHRAKDQRGWGYCVFGSVVHGFETLEKIRNVKTKMHPAFNAPVLPVEPVVIKDVSRMKKEDVDKMLEKAKKKPGKNAGN